MSFWSKWWNGMTSLTPGNVIGNAVDPLNSVSHALGLNSQFDYVIAGGILGGQSHLLDMAKADWSAVKHMMMPDMRRDREAMTNSGTAARRIIYGRTRVGGSMVYAETSGDKDEFLNLILVVAGHAISGYDEIWFNDQHAATISSGGGITVHAPFVGYASFELFDGYQTTASAAMVAASATNVGNWTADHKLIGCAYLYVKLTYSETVYASGIPQIKAVVRGKKVFDPRTGTLVYSDNPALCIRDYMMLAPELGGMGCDVTEIDNTYVTGAANICDQPIATAGGEKRYTLNGYIDLEGTPAAFLQPMIAAMAGQALYSGGVWRIYAGAATAPVATLDESWLNGGISFQAGNDKGGRVNTVKGTFTNPTDYWADTEFPTVIIDSYVTADGEELTLDMSMPFTTSPTTAQRLATIAIQKSRYGMALTYPCNMKAAHLNAQDTVAINNTQLGWVEKLFKILSWDFPAMGVVILSLVEDAPEIWGDPTLPGTLVPPVMTNLPNPWSVRAPTSLLAVESLYTGVTLGSIKSKISVTWVAADATANRYDIMINTVIQPVYDTAYQIMDCALDTYSISVRAVNGIGAHSAWVTTSITTTGKDSPPAAVTGFTAAALSTGQVALTWNPNSETDLAGYNIQIGATYQNPRTTNTAVISLFSGTSMIWQPATAGATTFQVVAVDTSGNISVAASATCTVATVGPTAEVAPTGTATYAVTTESLRNGNSVPMQNAVITIAATGATNTNSFDLRIKQSTASVYEYYSVPVGTLASTVVKLKVSPNTSYNMSIKLRNAGLTSASWTNNAGVAGDYTFSSGAISVTIAAPTGVASFPLVSGASFIMARWTAVNDVAVNRYKVEVATNVGFTVGLRTFYSTNSLLSFPAVAGNTYWARVTAMADEYTAASASYSIGSLAFTGVATKDVLAPTVLVAENIFTQGLSAITADLGDITAGTVTLNAAGGHIKGGQTAFNTGSGFFLGKEGTDYKFSIGAAAGNYLTYNSSTGALAFNGTVAMGVGSSLNWNNITAGTPPASVDNSNVTASGIGAISTSLNNAPPGILNSEVTATGINAVATNLSNAPAGILNSNVTAGGIGAISTSLNNAPPGILNSEVTAAGIGALATTSPKLTYIGATGIYTGTLTADQITTGVLTGTHIKTASSGYRIELNQPARPNEFLVYPTTGVNSNNPVVAITGGNTGQITVAGLNTTAITATGTGGNPTISGTASLSTGSGVAGINSGSGYGVMGQSSTGVAGSFVSTSGPGIAVSGGVASTIAGGLAVTGLFKIVAAATTTSPNGNITATVGCLYVTSDGKLYINTGGGTTWALVGTQT